MDKRNTKIIAAGMIACAAAALALYLSAAGPTGSAMPLLSRSTLPSHLIARPCTAREPCHQTWTLTARLGQILEVYEKRIGKRNGSYMLLGLEFTTTRRPSIRYPDYGQGARYLIVQLTSKAIGDRAMAHFQLSHEAFHLIEPIAPGGQGSYLEEGLANVFAFDYLLGEGLVRDVAAVQRFLTEPSYRDAFDLATRLGKLHSDFDERIKALRRRTGSFSRVTADDIRAAFPNAPEDLARSLARRFP